MLWKVYSLAKQLQARPSDLVGIAGVYRAWCFDEVVLEFGLACEDAMKDASEHKGKGKAPTAAQSRGKAENALRKMLGMQQKFRDIRSARHAKDDDG